MSRSAWIWVGVLFVLVLLFWWWHRHHRKPMPAPGIGTPLQSPAAAPPPTSIFSKLSADASAVGSIFGNVGSIFSGNKTG